MTKSRMEKNNQGTIKTAEMMKEETGMTNTITDTTTIAEKPGKTLIEVSSEKLRANKVREGLMRNFRYFRARQGMEDSSAKLDVLADEFADLLASLPDEQLARGANVVFAKTAFWEGGFESNHMVVGFEANTRYTPEERVNGVYPHVLWVHVKNPKAKQPKEFRLPKTYAEKAVAFFGTRLPDIPTQLLLELFELCWDGNEITICQHPSADEVLAKGKRLEGGRFFKPEGAAEGILAYCVGNHAYVSIPGAEPQMPVRFKNYGNNGNSPRRAD